MSRTLTIILMILAVALIAYNATLIDFENPLLGDSLIALIGIVACLCAIVLLLIYITSKKIEKKLDED
ncbi:uncharacterized membrane protein (DUF485 family) [Saonia flava]|uniref:Uncharacterized membrane protein (DUF485 family) n=1 Tax=Saonia flava TaxID=523696 RepID=A0A846QZN4_9FLAO|nr:hypothetical protein [Saonia flava]NJB71653.1 uncharacterized membrane protein (DUF485 family) [Saonia flava]